MNQITNEGHHPPLDNRRGTTLWKVNNYRSKILTGLLNDFTDLEKVGIEAGDFAVIRRSLEYFINAVTEIPNALLSGKPLYRMLEDFLELCQEWSEVRGETEDSILKRRRLMHKLRKQRQAISDKMRRLQYLLEKDTDVQLIADAYQAISGLMNLVPDVFRHLGKVVGKYLKVS